jgi:succinate-acetate transporter protein
MSIGEQLNDIRSDIFNIRLKNNLSDSILNYFTMSIGLFYYGCIYAKIIVKDNTKSFFYELIMLSGILQIILGIFDWYKKKTITLLTNTLFGILFISWYFKYKYILIENPDYKDKKYEGVFYILFIVLSALLIISSKSKGQMYSINFLALVVAFVFEVIDKYANKSWAKKTYGYAFIVSGGLFWITGIMRILNNQFLNRALVLVKE